MPDPHRHDVPAASAADPRAGLRRAVLAGVAAFGVVCAVLAFALPAGGARLVEVAEGFEATAALPDATVQRRGARPCRYEPKSGRHVCGREDWAFVGPYVARLGGETRRCVWMHPAPTGTATTIRYPNPSLGPRLRGRLGLVEGSGHGAALTVEFVVDGKSVGRVDVEDDVSAVPFDFAVPGVGPHDALEVRYSARRHDWRMGCLALASPAAEGSR